MSEENLSPEDLQGIISHVFLPRRLPSSEQEDLEKIEASILSIVGGITDKFNSGLFLNTIPRTCKLFRKWIVVQQQLSSSVTSACIADVIESLQAGDMLAFYVRAQNAGLLISIPTINEDLQGTMKENVIFSSFPAAARSTSVMSVPGDLIVVVPESSFIIPKSALLHSKDFAEQLGYLSRERIDRTIPKSSKAGNMFNEARDVVDPMFITDWAKATLCIEESNISEVFPRIRKKIRDDVNCHLSPIPFRRSGLWLTAKVALQISLIRELGPDSGPAVYKAVLIELMHFILISLPNEKNWDLKMQMLAKLARRLEKLKSSISKWSPLCHQKLKNSLINLTERVNTDIVLTRSLMDKQWGNVTNNLPPSTLITLANENLNNDTYHRHFQELISFIESRKEAMAYKLNLESHPKIPTPCCPIRSKSSKFINTTYSTSGYRLDIELFDTEVWIRSHLNDFSTKEFSERIWKLIKMYTNAASTHYQKDPIGTSRMVLTILKSLQVLDKIAVEEHPMLKEYKSGVKLSALHSLLIPLKSDMKLLHEMESYFLSRNAEAKYPSIIEEDSPRKDSFSVRFAKQFDTMSGLRIKILEQVERDIATKKLEVLNTRTICEDLKVEILELSHDSVWSLSHKRNVHPSNCTKCSLEKQHEATERSVTPYEQPLSNNHDDQYAVVFELLIPCEIAYLRDAVHFFQLETCGHSTFRCTTENIRNKWVSYEPLSPYSNGVGNVVKLGTLTSPSLVVYLNSKSKLSVYSNEDSFILNNGMNLIFFANPSLSSLQPLKERCTFQIEQSETAYFNLQWAVNDTSHTPNEVLSRQYSCHKDLSLPEFIQFGNLRAGHRLQYRNIIMSLVNSKLSLKAESVFLLLCQAQWQAGPPSNAYDDLRDSHPDFSDIPFARKSLEILSKLVEANSKNWSDSYTLMNLISISTRLIEIVVDQNLRDEVADLLRKCRRIANSWIDTISELLSTAFNKLETEMADMKLKLVDAALCLALTYHVSTDHTDFVMTTSEDLSLWLFAASTLYDEILWNMPGRSFSLSPVRLTILRLSINIGMTLEKRIDRLHSKTHATGLNAFAQNRWKVGETFGMWQKCGKPADQVYECNEAISNDGLSHVVHVDVVLGKFLVDGIPVGKLPEKIVKSKIYERIFLKADFRVQSNKDNIFTTTSEYHKCLYDFAFINDRVVINEFKKDESKGKRKLELICHTFFDQMVPRYLVENYSHWWNSLENTIIFRSKSFHDPNFSDSETYLLCLKTMLLTEIGMARNLISVKSRSYSKLISTLNRIEPPEYIHAWLNEGQGGTVGIELARLRLRFQLENGVLISKEYPGMQISLDQNLRTLVGLQNYLVLNETCTSKSFQLPRRIIVPHGNLQVIPGTNHQYTTIYLGTLWEPRSFVYEVDARLQTLKAGRNQSAWFFLAALHAATASPFPDLFTGVTGTERAFQILQSTCSWSSQPYDEPSLKILKIIANFSPIRTYYPINLQCMQREKWPTGLPTLASHEGFAEITLKLFEDSKRFGTLFQPLTNEHVNQSGNGSTEKDFADELLTGSSRNLRLRHYWRQLPLGNELSTISKEFDENFQSTRPSVSYYKRTSLLDNRTEKVNHIRTIADLCHSWRFHLESGMICKLRTLLITTARLKGRSQSANKIASANVQDWQKFNFRDEWINLYSLALKVARKNWKPKWTLILSILAFNGVPLEEIFILQAVAANPENFPRAPNIEIFTRPSEIYSRKPILNIFKRHGKPFIKYDSQGAPIYSTSLKLSNASEIHRSNIAKEAERLADHVTNQWQQGPSSGYRPCEGASVIEICKAEKAINLKLKQLYENYQLDDFVTVVEVNLTSLLGLSSSKPQIKDHSERKLKEDWEPSAAVPKFSIDYDQMLTYQISKTKEDQIAAQIYRTGTYASLNSYATIEEEIRQNLPLIIVKSKAIWNYVVNLMSPKGCEALIASGLFPRLIPNTLLPILLKNYESQKWKTIQSLLGSVGVLWTMEQRLIRCITYRKAGVSMEVALQKEIETKGHENWSPMYHPGWLILELEMNMMIRPIQLKVTQEMLNPRTGRNSVTQLNMGEGKTSLIVPMLAISIANGQQLCRVTVLKSIFETNLNHLRHTLGGMLGQKVYTVPCRRDIAINSSTCSAILTAYKECMRKRGIVVTLPEHRLSFQLKGYETARNGETTLAQSLIGIQTWLNIHVRDILDESDEILSVKYQLVYTVGDQLHVGGGEMRWIIVQNLLKLLPQRMQDLYDLHGESSVEIEISGKKTSETFKPCRLLRKECYEDLINFLAEDLLNGKLMSFPQTKSHERCLIKQFLTNNSLSAEDHAAALRIFEEVGASKNQEVLLIMAGYLKYGVIQAALSKRWRVNYGVNPRGHRKMAVPFKAKDVASERTEFGHPDMAIVLTQLSYYYSGLSDDQLKDCFDILKHRTRDPASKYDAWIQTIPDEKVHPSVRTYNGINLSDFEQRTVHLFPMLRKVMVVIDFWLSNVVFPKESKQFPDKMTCTAWDLSSQNQNLLTTGFSGTNDSSNLYPLTISQNDLEELDSTNRDLEATLMKDENDSYEDLDCGIRCTDLLEKLKTAGIRIMLDCGALMLEKNNEEVAKAWLETDKHIQAVVYFNQCNVLTVKSRQGSDVQFELSPFRDRMDVCAVYLDDEHTRGTDLKFSRGSKACVTIGSGLTRDKMVQACMRMRMLGQGHTVSFWASREAHNKIQDFTGWVGRCRSKDVLKWVCENSKQFQDESLVYWTASGVNYCKKIGGETIFKAESQRDPSQQRDHVRQLGENCSDKEVIELMKMYGKFRKEEFFINIIPSWFSKAKYDLTVNNRLPQLAVQLFADVENRVVARCRKFISEKKNFSQLLEEEQEKELENELEDEKEVSRPHEATPFEHRFDSNIFQTLRLQATGRLKYLESNGCIKPLPFGFQNTRFWDLVQPDDWGIRIYVTDDFTRTIVPKNIKDTVDTFLRPPEWVIRVRLQANLSSLLLISPFEANECIHDFREGGVGSCTLHIYTPRLMPEQRILIDCANLCLPSAADFKLDDNLLACLSLFSGTLYFASVEEQIAVANFLGIIPRPRKKKQDEAFEREELSQNGFVKPEYRTITLSNIRKEAFKENPDSLITEIVRTRNQGYIPQTSHISKLVLDGMMNVMSSGDELDPSKSKKKELKTMIQSREEHEPKAKRSRNS